MGRYFGDVGTGICLSVLIQRRDGEHGQGFPSPITHVRRPETPVPTISMIVVRCVRGLFPSVEADLAVVYELP